MGIENTKESVGKIEIRMGFRRRTAEFKKKVEEFRIRTEDKQKQRSNVSLDDVRLRGREGGEKTGDEDENQLLVLLRVFCFEVVKDVGQNISEELDGLIRSG